MVLILTIPTLTLRIRNGLNVSWLITTAPRAGTTQIVTIHTSTSVVLEVRMHQHFDSVNQSILYSLYLTCFSFVVITSPPYNLVVSDLTYSSLVLSWDEIPLTERHAPILGYIISYSEVSSGSTEIEVQINSSSLSVTIENLQFGVTYNFTIRASGALGDSPVSSVETTTPFKGTFVVFYSESCCLLNYLRALYRITESNSTLRNIFFFCYPMV